MATISAFLTAKLLLYSSMTLFSVNAQVSCPWLVRMSNISTIQYMCELLQRRLPSGGHIRLISSIPWIELPWWPDSSGSVLQLLLWRGTILWLPFSRMPPLPFWMPIMHWPFFDWVFVLSLRLLPLFSRLHFSDRRVPPQEPSTSWDSGVVCDKPIIRD